MPLGDPYAELGELKNRLNIPDADSDTQLNQALSASSRGVERFCRRQFNQVTTASARVYHPITPVLTFVDDFHTSTDLEVKVDEGGDGSFATPFTDYQLEPLNGIVDGEPGWPFWRLRAIASASFPQADRPAVQVTAQWGWAEVPIPVQEATLIVAEETFKLKDAPFGVAGFGEFGSVRVRENPKVAQMLSPYRRTAVRVA